MDSKANSYESRLFQAVLTSVTVRDFAATLLLNTQCVLETVHAIIPCNAKERCLGLDSRLLYIRNDSIFTVQTDFCSYKNMML